MANIDEAFAALSDVQSVSVNENVDFVVDSNLRVISIPVRGVVLGVEGDKDVNRVTFRMSRTYKGIDMSQFQIRINYANANNELNYFKVTEITVGDDEIVFVWVVGADAVAYVGNVEFVVRFIKLSGSNIIQELNTTLATAKSLIGLSVDGEISPVQREDLLAHFYSEIDAYSETKKNEILDSIPEDYTALANEVDELKGDLVDFEDKTFTKELVGKSKNLLDWSKVSYEKILLSDGTLGDNNLRWTTDFIPLTEENRSIVSSYLFIASNGSQNRKTRTWTHMACYDSNKNYISGTYSATEMSSYTATDDNIAYIRMSFNPNQAGSQETDKYLMIEYGDTINPSLDDYVPYNEGHYEYTLNNSSIPKNVSTDEKISEKLKEYSFVEKIRGYLPPQIYVAIGRTIELYNKQVVCGCNWKNYIFEWICDIGKNLDRKYQIDATNLSVGSYDITLNIRDYNNNIVLTLTSVVEICPNTIPNNVNICPIGDSLTNGKAWLSECRNLSDDKIKYVGTRWRNDIEGGNLNHEGRSGVSPYSLYMTNFNYTFDSDGKSASNPFYNPDTKKFGWNYYLSTNSIVANAVQIYLGMNGLKLNTDDGDGTWFGSNVQVNSIKRIVESIRSDDSNIPIFLCFPQYQGGQNAQGNMTPSDGYVGGSGLAYYRQMCIYNIMEQLGSYFEGAENIYFIPLSLEHDSDNNYATQSKPVNPRAEQVEVVQIESTHPLNQGYLQMADSMFSAYCYAFNM